MIEYLGLRAVCPYNEQMAVWNRGVWRDLSAYVFATAINFLCLSQVTYLMAAGSTN